MFKFSLFYRYEAEILNRFSKFNNGVPDIEVNFSKYIYRDIASKKAIVSSANNTYAYRVDIDIYSKIKRELSGIVTAQDYVIYDLNQSYLYEKGKPRTEINELINLKTIPDVL